MEDRRYKTCFLSMVLLSITKRSRVSDIDLFSIMQPVSSLNFKLFLASVYAKENHIKMDFHDNETYMIKRLT